MTANRRVLISRTDAIGDVVLTLPLASIIKESLPNVYIGFLGKSYTKPVIECCSAVDEFVDVDNFLKEDPKQLKENWDTIVHVFPRRDIAEKARQAGIGVRVGTTNRLYHLVTCNKLVRLSRKNSSLHEAQLNIRLLAPLGIAKEYTKSQLGQQFAFDRLPALAAELSALLTPGKKHIILHPKSQGSAREWGLDHFEQLIGMLPKDEYQLFISGTTKEAELMQHFLKKVNTEVTDITGRISLGQFISFIHHSDALVAASTGPLHIAAALGKVAIGLYPSIRPMHAGRWAPLGVQAVAFALPNDCTKCKTSPENCSCIKSISAAQVAQHLRTTLV